MNLFDVFYWTAILLEMAIRMPLQKAEKSTGSKRTTDFPNGDFAFRNFVYHNGRFTADFHRNSLAGFCQLQSSRLDGLVRGDPSDGCPGRIRQSSPGFKVQLVSLAGNLRWAHAGNERNLQIYSSPDVCKPMALGDRTNSIYYKTGWQDRSISFFSSPSTLFACGQKKR